MTARRRAGAAAEPDGRTRTSWSRRAGFPVLLAGTAALAAAACFSEDPDPMEPLPAECRQLALDAGVNPDAPDVTVVGIRNFAFVPNQVTVAAGTRVVWVNCEAEGQVGGDHTSTSDAGVWDSPLLSPGDTYQRVFAEAGDFDFHCTPHPFMMGTVSVEGG